jgi:hypothetical protein
MRWCAAFLEAEYSAVLMRPRHQTQCSQAESSQLSPTGPVVFSLHSAPPAAQSVARAVQQAAPPDVATQLPPAHSVGFELAPASTAVPAERMTEVIDDLEINEHNFEYYLSLCLTDPRFPRTAPHPPFPQRSWWC